ncbi:MAG: SDR family oxidoreductase [Paracoccaceae bacterium]
MPAPILDCAKGFRLSFELNVKSLYRVTCASCPPCWHGGGSIVNIASVASSIIAASTARLCATKAAVIASPNRWSADVTRSNRRNAICPRHRGTSPSNNA